MNTINCKINLLHDTFAVKSAGNNLAKYIAGRSVHAPMPVAGGFLKIPDNEGKNNTY